MKIILKKNLILFIITLFLLNTFLFIMPLCLYGYPSDQCTAYAKEKRPDLPDNLGHAKDWAKNAEDQGFPVDKTPNEGDIVVFQPKVYDADEIYGHVAYVEKTIDGTFNISERNFDGKSYNERYDLVVITGVSFIHKKDTTVSQEAEQSAIPTEKNFFGVISDWFNNLWNNIIDIFTVRAAEPSTAKSATIAASQESKQGIQGSVTTETTAPISPPTKPSLVSPYNWYQSLGTAPNLMWKGDSNSKYYYVVVNSSNTGNVVSGWITSTSWKPNLPNQNYVYTWKVKAKNSQGVEGPWSDESHFSITSTTLQFEGDISFNPSSPSSADQIKIFASTTGWGGVGVTLRVSVNTAPDGSSNGEWKILKELGVPKFNENDAPVWNTKGWQNGIYKIRVEAKGPNDPNWQNPAVIETTYTLVNKPIESEKRYEESNIDIDPGSLLLNEDFSSGNLDFWNLVAGITIYNDAGNNVAKCVSKTEGGAGNEYTDMYYHFYIQSSSNQQIMINSIKNLNFSCRIKAVDFSSGGTEVYAVFISDTGELVGSIGQRFSPGELPIGSWKTLTFRENLSGYPDFDLIILGATVNGNNVVYFDDFKIY